MVERCDKGTKRQQSIMVAKLVYFNDFLVVAVNVCIESPVFSIGDLSTRLRNTNKRFPHCIYVYPHKPVEQTSRPRVAEQGRELYGALPFKKSSPDGTRTQEHTDTVRRPTWLV